MMADQKEVLVYVCQRSWRCWLTRRLLERRGYRFEVIDLPATPDCAPGWRTSRDARRCPTSSSTTDRSVAWARSGRSSAPAPSITWCGAKCREPSCWAAASS